MASYNLLDEPWIPVLDAGTDLRSNPRHPVFLREVGLREALQRAHELREVYCDNPLEIIALNRLLLALCIDAFCPAPDPDAWIEIWKMGSFDSTMLDQYLTEHDLYHRFDLLDPNRPFYQHPVPHASAIERIPAPLSKLFHAEACGNNATLFGHQLDTWKRKLPLNATARAIVGTQATALGGGVSKPFNFSHGPLVGGAVFWIRGRSLFDALLLNAPPDPEARLWVDDELHTPIEDLPCWRRPLPIEHSRRPATGLLDYLTWQSRRLTLQVEGDQAVAVYNTQGDKDEPAVGIRDPQVARVESKKAGIYPFGFRTDRALWRDADVLFKRTGRGDVGAPKTFEWLQLQANDEYPAQAVEMEAQGWLVDAFGLVNDKAKPLQWRHERLPVYKAFLEEPERLRQLKSALAYAEDQASTLRFATRTVATYLLDPPPPGSNDYPSPDKKDVSNLSASLDTNTRYWAALEPHFYLLLRDLATVPNEAARIERLWPWAERLYQEAVGAFESATGMLDQNARVLRAFAEGRKRLWRVNEYRDHRKTQNEVAV